MDSIVELQFGRFGEVVRRAVSCTNVNNKARVYFTQLDDVAWARNDRHDKWIRIRILENQIFRIIRND